MPVVSMVSSSSRTVPSVFVHSYEMMRSSLFDSASSIVAEQVELELMRVDENTTVETTGAVFVTRTTESVVIELVS